MSEAPVQPPQQSRHSTWAIVWRVLGAIGVVALAIVVDRVVFADGPGHERFGATVRTLTLESSALERDVPLKVVVPPRAPPRERSLLVFLHGRGEDERSYLIDEMFEALSGLRGRAPVVAFPFGGDSSYWHNRESGDWAGYVLGEVIPRLVERFDVDPDRIAIGGISMGGYGAYNLAAQDPGAFCAVGGHSPALWESASETADGAFDDAEDFESNDVIAAAAEDPSPYEGTPLWIDAGESDPFLAGDDALEQALRDNGTAPIVRRSPGDHDSDYWNDNWKEYLTFYAHALRSCVPPIGAPEPGDDADDVGAPDAADSPGADEPNEPSGPGEVSGLNDSSGPSTREGRRDAR